MPKDDRTYDLAPEPVRKNVRTASNPGPVLSYQTPSATPKQPDYDPTIELRMPLAILAAGVLIQALAAIIQANGAGGWAAAMRGLFVNLIVGTAVMLAGMTIAAKFRGIELGRFWLAVLKLSAVAIGPAAAGTLLLPIAAVIPLGIPLGTMGGLSLMSLAILAIEFVLYFALLGAMFSLDESDTWYCICVIFVLRVALYFGTRLI